MNAMGISPAQQRKMKKFITFLIIVKCIALFYIK